ncbi:efflux RND transporter permease subunit [Alteromonas pelagimontana]|uniref:Efflux RND transporter permease subunit n=1 Tax=Alteromonas pelagimontana TaxID=1858656 RepID=A0A6M4M877_9ALTE|nr:efflux RND transporter permease subunit [Alteromonas pelagimontana]QJR79431.1 efflux RND transporter permease subunit [Alteromonas pelagimontana]
MKIVDIAVKRPVAVAMFTFAVLLFGMVSLNRLSINLLPELSYPTLTIRTDYAGAAPAEIEQLVSKPIEEAVGVVKGVRSVTSTSRPDQSDVVLEFIWGTDMDFASLEVREKLDILQLPLDVSKPRLLRFNPSLDPIMRMGLNLKPDTADADPQHAVVQMKTLRTYAEEQIKRSLESIEGVASVRIGGGLENEIHVLIDQRKASQLHISLTSVIERLEKENVNVAGGRVEDGSQAYLVRTLNQFDNLTQVEQMYVGRFEGRNIQLQDIATVTNTFKERSAVTRFDGIEGAEIAIYKEGDANAVDVANSVRQQISRIEQVLPASYELKQVYDQSVFIKQAIDDVKSAAVIGGILAIVVLYLFLRNFWPTLIISVSIPVSVIATFNLMYANDISLNIMSLGGIALAVGLLVDNSIVVLENIDRKRRNQLDKEDLRTAASTGTREVSGAIIASTLTTMAVFVPLVFVEGIAGQLFSDQALTVSFALAASLVVALTLIPTLASRTKQKSLAHQQTFDRPSSPAPSTLTGRIAYWALLPFKLLLRLVFVFLPAAIMTSIIGLWRIAAKMLYWIFRPLATVFNAGFTVLETVYDRILKGALQHQSTVLGITLVITAMSLLLLPRLGMELVPKMSQGEFFVEVNLPAGAKVEQTDELLSDLASLASRQTSVARTYSLAGTGSLISASPSQGGDHWGKFNVVMQPGTTEADAEAVREALRQYLASRAGVQSRFGEPELFSFAAPLQIELQGYDLNQLQTNSHKIVAGLEANSRFADVTSTLRSGNPELKIVFNQAKLTRLGLDAPTVSQVVAAQVGGKVATQYSMNDRKVDVLVRTQDKQRDHVNDVKAIIINPEGEQPVPLAAVADVYMSTGPSEITRVGQQRVVLIEANIAYGDLSQGVIDAQAVLDSIILPVSLKATIAGQSEDMQQSFVSLQFALALAVFMVYLVMASQFESLLHPLLILFAVPLAGAGSIYGLWVTNTYISVVVFIGLIMLCGIVVNNAIVLIDRINQLRQQGMNKQSAITAAAKSRLRPIVMTTLTTILGLLPMAIGFGDGAEVRTPMAVTVISGLLFSTLLTLVLLPVLYSLFDRKTYEAVTTVADEKEHIYG